MDPVGDHQHRNRLTGQSEVEAHWHTEGMHAQNHSEQEMAPGRVSAVGHLVSSWQQLQHQVPYKFDSTHGRLEEGEEEVEVM